MADTIKKYLDQAGLEELVGKIKEADVATLQSAKDYCDGKDKLFETAGAETRAKAYTDEKVAPLATTVALNAVDKKVDDEVARATAEEERIVKLIEDTDAVADKAAEDVAALAQTHATDKAALEAKDKELAGAIEAVDAKVGEIPVVEGQETPATVIEYINKKTEGIATDTALAQLQSDLDLVEADVATIKGDYLKGSDKTELANAIAAEAETARAAEKANADAIDAIEADYLKAEDKTELQGNIDAVSAVANAAVKQSDYNTKVAELVAEDARIAGLVTAETERATGVETGLDERLAKVETFFELAEGEKLDEAKDTLIEIQKIIDSDAAVADQMLLDIAANKKAIDDHKATNHDFAAADATLKAELEGKINAKADSSVVEGINGRLTTAEGSLATVAGKVTTLEGEMDAVEAAVATKVEQEAYNTKVTELANADSAQVERIAALEAKFGEGEGSVEDMIADVQATAAADATEKANAAKEAAIAKANELDTVMDARMDVVEAKAHEHANKAELDKFVDGDKAKLDDAATKAHVHANASVLDGISAEKVAAWDAAEQNAKTYSDGLNTAMTTKVEALEDVVDTKADAETVEELAETVGTNQTSIATNAENIAKNASAIAAFSAISTEDIEKLFA